MPLNARWRGINIVAPLTPNREQELIGGLKNALDRGETIMKAKQSFINAGYKQAEVEAAARKVPAATQQISKPVAATIPEKTLSKPTTQAQQVTTTTTTPTQPKKLSKTFIIILIVSSALVLIGAAILGLFWNTWFG
jgi:hypothetical protein